MNATCYVILIEQNGHEIQVSAYGGEGETRDLTHEELAELRDRLTRYLEVSSSETQPRRA